jgi:hypothetical protein
MSAVFSDFGSCSFQHLNEDVFAAGIPNRRCHDLRSPLGLVMQPPAVVPNIPDDLDAQSSAYTSKSGQSNFR